MLHSCSHWSSHPSIALTGSIDFGNYNGYLTWPYQVVGVSSALLVFGIVFFGVLDSRLFDFLIANDGDDDEGSDSDWVTVELKDRRGSDGVSKFKSNQQESQTLQSSTDYSNMDDLEQVDKKTTTNNIPNKAMENDVDFKNGLSSRIRGNYINLHRNLEQNPNAISRNGDCHSINL